MKLFKILGITIALLFAAVIAFVIYTMQQAYYYQGVIGPGLDSQLGFRHGSPYVATGGPVVEVFTLYPKQDGAFSAAGVRDGDIVLDYSITGFYRALHKRRGSIITFRVTDGGNGLPIAQRPVRTITLRVPLPVQSNERGIVPRG